jgi:hypothetical protein
LQDVLPEVLLEVWVTSSSVATDGTGDTRPWWPWTSEPCPGRVVTLSSHTPFFDKIATKIVV